MNRYDVVIVGAGPAGIFTALELTRARPDKGKLSILMVEKGPDLAARPRLEDARAMGPNDKRLRWQISGFGGAGAYSDGKLTLSPEVGGYLDEYVGKLGLVDLIESVDDDYLRFGADDRVYGTGDEVSELRRKASLAGLRLLPVPIRHMGTDRCLNVLARMRDYLLTHVELRTETQVVRILVDGRRVAGVELRGGETVEADYVVVAPGREGSDWLLTEARRLGLTLKQNPVDIGVRVEVHAAVLEHLTDALYESKLELYTRAFDDRIRTFCVCPNGEVTAEYTGGEDPVITVNGHSYAERFTDRTNFALLVSTSFTDPFREPIAYGRYIARLANLLGGGVIVQRLGDLQSGRRSTKERIKRGLVQPTLAAATPGDLSFVLPYRYLTNIVEMLEAMDQLAPGVASRNTLLYGVEVKFYSVRPNVSETLETEVGNLFAIGDGAGITRGLVQASASGLVAAREILRRKASQ